MSIIKRDRVSVEPFIPMPETSGDAHREKSVRLLRRDGVVMALELSCSCGEITVVEFGDEPAVAPIEAAQPVATSLPEEEVQ